MFLKNIKYPWRWLLVGILALGFIRFLQWGFVEGTDWFYPNPLRVSQLLSWPTIFTPFGLNGYLGSLLPMGVMQTVFALLVKLTSSIVGVGWILYYVPSIVLPALGTWLLVKRWTDSEKASFVAALAYTVNTYYLTILVGGQLSVAVAYSLIPWVVLLTEKSFLDKTGNRFTVYWLAIVLAAVGYYDARFLVIIGLILAGWFVYAISLLKGRWKQTVKKLLLAAIAFVTLSWVWIYGTFFVKGTSLAPIGYDSPSWLSTLSYATWKNTVALQHVWWPPGQGQLTTISPWLYIIPVFIVLGLLVAGNQRRRLWLLLAIALVGIFLAKGVNPPLGGLYSWLFTHCPLFVGFRDPAKFFSLVSFGYAVGLGISVNSVYQAVKWLPLKVFVPAVLLSMWTVVYWPLWTQQVSGAFIKRPIEYQAVNNWFSSLEDYKDWYRVLWWPTDYRGLDFDPKHPVIQANDSSLLASAKDHVPSFRRWLETGDKGDSNIVDFALDAYGVHYIAVPGDVARELYTSSQNLSQKQFNNALSDGLGYKEVANITDEDGLSTRVYKNDGTNSLITTVPTIFVSNGEENPFLKKVITSARSGITKIIDINEPLDVQSLPGVALISLPAQASELQRGQLSWRINLAHDTDLRLLLPNQYDFLIDGDPLQSTEALSISGESYRLYEKFFTEGEHGIKLAPENEQRLAYLVDNTPVLTEWEPCQKANVNFLENFNQELNEEYLQDNESGVWVPSTEARCVQKEVIPSDKLSYLYVSGQSVQASDAYLYINFVGKVDYRVPVSDLSQGVLLEVKDDDYEKIVMAVVLPSNATTDFSLNSLSVKSMPTMLAKALPLVITDTLSSWPISDETIDQPLEQPSFQRDGEGRVSVKLRGADKPYGLVMSTQFHDQWVLVGEDGREVDTHFKTGLNLNGWYLTGQEVGNYKIIFKPYYRLISAAYVTLSAWLLLILYLIVERRRS